MAAIQLDRRFVEWSSGTKSDADYLRMIASKRSNLGWQELLTHKRVVILAEGGSGKSSELLEQHRIQNELGNFSFYLTVKKVGGHGVENSLPRTQRERFDQWRISGKPAFLFIDSVDEAKLNGVALMDALHHVASAIEGLELHAHLFISGRNADWEFRKDLESITSIIPVPQDPQMLAAIDPAQLVVKTIRREKKEATPKEETALVCLMAPLEKKQVEKYANGKGIENPEAFFSALETAKLWSFARRPLDLDWLVRYWKQHHAFDKFEKMLSVNLKERLRETDPGRAKSIRFDQTQAMEAIERIGAALVLEKLNDIEIPDSGNMATPLAALRLTDIWKDMPQELQGQIINSPIFVPSGVGLVRLQNDNEGVVRAYLAAKWLKRLLDNNCPWKNVLNLLFSSTHGIDLVKPSMRQTAAWLALWDDRAAQEVIRREPILLMEEGDPASLTLATRKTALEAVVAKLGDDNSFLWLNHDGLRRFAWHDMEPTIRDLWAKCKTVESVRHLLLQMISLSELSGCGDIARETAFDLKNDELTLALAGQALLAAGDESAKRAYSRFLLANVGVLPPTVTWNAIEELSPRVITGDDFLLLLPALLTKECDNHAGIDLYGPRIAAKLEDVDEANRLLTFLLNRIPSVGRDLSQAQYDEITPLFSTLFALAERVLDLTPDQEPSDPAIDVSLQLNYCTGMHGDRGKHGEAVTQKLHNTPLRRRAALWRLAETYASFDSSSSILNKPWQLHLAGFNPSVAEEDIGWLLEDAQKKSKDSDRSLAICLVMSHWLATGKPQGLRKMVLKAAGTSTELKTLVADYAKPSALSAMQKKADSDTKKYAAKQAVLTKKVDDSWVAFAKNIAGNPSQLGSLLAPNSKVIDARIFHIWELFQRLNDNSSRHSSSDVRLLTPLFGEAAIPHIRDAFIAYWRLGEPLLRGERSVEGRNTGNAMEMIGLVGIAMEAAKNIDWARKLSNQDATKAATYGTLELNGFPEWFAELCLKKPLICADVLRRDLAHELTSTSPETRYGLDRLARAEDQIAQTLAEDMLKLIESEASSELPTEVLEPVLKIALRSDEKEKFLHVLLSRAHAAHTPDKIAKYLTAAFAIDSKTSTQALLEIEKTLSEHDAVQLALQVLPPIMGTAWAMEKHDIADFEAEDLEKLIVFAYDRIQPATDLDHTGGKVYSPGLRDHAQDARNGAIQKLARMPGAATARALNQLMNLPSPPIPKENLAKLIVSHAQSDAESAAWTSTDVVGFENDFTTVPRTPADLQRVAASRIEDLQHHLSDSDYGRASAVAMLPREVDVQNWMANELEKKQGRSFTLEREGHVADEKEPDIRLTASGTSARLPIEIKVAESWTLKELDKALTEQLMGRYLRAHNARWGILLVVHQKARPEGWEDTEAGKFLTFPEVIKRLQAKALAISASDATAAQMQVCVIDVSMAPIDAPKRKPAPKKSTSSTHKPPTDGQET